MNNESTVLIVGEDTGMSFMLSTLGLRPIVVGGPQEALTKRQNLLPSLVVLNLPGGSLEPRFLDAVSRGGVPVLLLADPDASFGKVNRKNGRNGKIRVLTRPVRDGELQAAVRTLLEGPSNASWDQAATTGTLVGERYLAEYAPLFLSQKMRAVKEIIEQVADTNATVLIRGESGVGKDIVARAIHYASPRRSHPFVKVNCASFPTDLLESELFGHEKGAFTGAYQKTLGKFELANKGTFFLDEIGELPVGLQAKLLHVLQDHEFSRVGGRQQMIHVDTRVIASTNRDLEIALSNGQFREDLYYRLNVVEIHVPPLRQRREEIPILAMSFLDKFNQQDDQKVELSPETITLFTEYSWPGNVRELENTILRLVVLGSIPQIHEEILNRLRSLPPKQSEPKGAQAVLQPPSKIPLGLREVARRAAQEAERRAIREVLDRVHWNRSEAARLLKVSYKTLLNKINDCGLIPNHKRSQS